MIQSATTGESGAQRVNEKRDKAQWQEDQARESEEMEGTRGGKRQRGRDMVSRAD